MTLPTRASSAKSTPAESVNLRAPFNVCSTTRSPPASTAAGFSQGGAIALHLGLRYAHALGGILALSTYLPLADHLADEAAPVQQATPIFIAHGTRDPLVPEQLGNHAADTLRAAGYAVTYEAYPMEHAVSAAEIADIAAWLKARFG